MIKDYLNKFSLLLQERGLLTLAAHCYLFARNRLFMLPILDMISFNLSKRALEKMQEDERTVDDIVNTSWKYSGIGYYHTIKPYQVKSEFRKLLGEVVQLKPKIILEIGTARGGALYGFVRVAPNDALVISLDLPGGKFGGGYPKSKIRFFELFKKRGQNLKFIRKDSHSMDAYNEVLSILNGRKIDFLFIDADHTYEGAKQDFEMYSQLVSRKNGIIALHDIVPHVKHTTCKVDQLWQEVKEKHTISEIIENDKQEWAGIGIVRLNK
jgi:predicted O-methyltransferase YrrM